MKHILLIVLVVLVFVIALTRCGVFVTTDYPSAIMWHDTLYGGSGEMLSDDGVGNKLGEVTRNVSKMPSKNGHANSQSAGSHIFEVKGLSTNEAIAVEENGQYRVFTPLK